MTTGYQGYLERKRLKEALDSDKQQSWERRSSIVKAAMEARAKRAKIVKAMPAPQPRKTTREE